MQFILEACLFVLHFLVMLIYYKVFNEEREWCFVLQGDFLVHFMDIAKDELTKKLEEISVEKLQVRSFPCRCLLTNFVCS